MYAVMVYDESIDDFRPMKTEFGTRLEFEDWSEASGAIADLRRTHPGEQYKVWYRTIKPRKRGRKAV